MQCSHLVQKVISVLSCDVQRSMTKIGKLGYICLEKKKKKKALGW